VVDTMSQPSYFDPNVTDIPDHFMESAYAQLRRNHGQRCDCNRPVKHTDLTDLAEVASKLWETAQRDAETEGP
jgi:hypothetical protein